MLRSIGICPESYSAYLDHVVPLCHVMNAPLLVTEPWLEQLVKSYYPPMEVILVEPERGDLSPYLQGYDLLIYTHFFKKKANFFHFGSSGAHLNVRSLMSLHGQPDKYNNCYWVEQVESEDVVLSYGGLLETLVRDKGIGKEFVRCGNYRLEFYKNNKDFFQKMLPIESKGKTILYAPTWIASEKKAVEGKKYSSRCLEVFKELCASVPSGYTLWVKMHFLSILHFDAELSVLEEEYPHVRFLGDCPLVYPILDQVDIYIGDYSSLGYDFLYFGKKCFFLEVDEPTTLHGCGKVLHREDLRHLEEILEEEQESDSKRVLYEKVYGKRVSLEELQKRIKHAYRSSDAKV